jgi:predicted nucleic acid-binding protein
MKLIDTSNWVDYLRGLPSPAAASTEDLLLRGHAAWCDVTLVELWHGARGAKEKRELTEMEKEIDLIPVDAPAWRLASKLALRSREKGITAPLSDIIIAACAVRHDLELEHTDKHFDDLLPLAKSL